MKTYWLVVLILIAHDAKAADSYADVTSAAVAGLTAAESLTGDFEAGGAIYQCGERFAFLPPVTNGKKTSLSIPIATVGECVLAGLFHTHPKGDGRFSAVDIATACKLNTLSFIKPKNGVVRVFDCRALTYVERQVLNTRPVTGKEI